MTPTPSTPTKDNFLDFQKKSVSIFSSCLLVYEALTNIPSLKVALGVSYPWFLMFITMVGLTAASVSGYQLWAFLDRMKKVKDQLEKAQNELKEED